MGTVTIGDDVEIGANAGIDRRRLQRDGDRRGDQDRQPGPRRPQCDHRPACLIMGQVAFAGSTRRGLRVMASQSGIAGHLSLGSQATIGGKSGVIRDVPDRETVLGIPAVADRQAKRQWVAVAQRPDLLLRSGNWSAGSRTCPKKSP